MADFNAYEMTLSIKLVVPAGQTFPTGGIPVAVRTAVLQQWGATVSASVALPTLEISDATEVTLP